MRGDEARGAPGHGWTWQNLVRPDFRFCLVKFYFHFTMYGGHKPCALGYKPKKISRIRLRVAAAALWRGKAGQPTQLQV